MEKINNLQKANQTDQLEELGFKMKSKNHSLPREESERILGNEIPCMWEEIPKEETQYRYGGAARKIEIASIGKHGTFIRIPFSEIPEAESVISGRFSYTMKNKPISAGRKKTGAFFDENRKLDARFRVKCCREFAESNASTPTVQIQRIRLCSAAISYRKWDFMVMDVSRAFLRPEPLKEIHMYNYQKKE